MRRWIGHRKSPWNKLRPYESRQETFVIVRDSSNRLVNEVKIPTMPSSFVLDKSGKVHSFHRGFKGAETKKQYIEEIDSLLK